MTQAQTDPARQLDWLNRNDRDDVDRHLGHAMRLAGNGYHVPVEAFRHLEHAVRRNHERLRITEVILSTILDERRRGR